MTAMRKRSLLFIVGVCAARGALALYDSKPSDLLVDAPGAWRGTLRYRDYQNPEKMVTLVTRLVVSLSAPEELALYYVYDDGPGKTVYSYERMSFDFANKELVWRSGSRTPEQSVYRITSAAVGGGSSRIAFERSIDTRVDRYALEIGSGSWALSKAEFLAGGAATLRNQYEFTKVGA